MIVLPGCRIFSHHKSLTPSKSIPNKNNHDFKEKYPYVRAGTLEPMRIKEILTKNSFFVVRQRFKNTSEAHNDIRFGKEVS